MKLVQRLLLLGFILATAGCTEWWGTRLPALAPDAPLNLGAARVTTVDSRTLARDSVVVTADSVVGYWASGRWPTERMALHRSQVRHVERRGLPTRRSR